MTDSKWKIGKILQFSHFSAKKTKAQQYSGSRASLLPADKPEALGVLCSWYSNSKENVFTLNSDTKGDTTTHHGYYPLESYLCTLPPSSFLLEPDCKENEGGIKSRFLCGDSKTIQIRTAYQLTLKDETLDFIDSLIKERAATQKKQDNQEAISEQTPTGKQTQKVEDQKWVRHGNITLTRRDYLIVTNGKELTDLHINAYQNLLKNTYPTIGGLQNTLFQSLKPLHYKLSGQALQILHIRGCHWATLSIQGGRVEIYDTSFTSLNGDTLQTIFQLLRWKTNPLKINLMNTAKQSGSTDCGLYAAAVTTCLALGMDPLAVVFRQQDLRDHFLKVLRTGQIEPFPVLKKRRLSDRILKTKEFDVFCSCRTPHDGRYMAECCKCREWFHDGCEEELPDEEELKKRDWFCLQCRV